MKKTHDAAMVVIERAYGERPQFNYYIGTSQGGREALTVAQRYPSDYDGVAANVPIVGFSTLMLAPELIRIHEKPQANWVTPAKVNAIRGEFMRQCDGLDGLADGIINNYMACRAIFDVTQGARNRQPWAAKRCPNNVDPNPDDTSAGACLTDGQISTLQFIYSRYPFATPLAHGAKTFGMWVPNTDPVRQRTDPERALPGQEGAADGAPMHAHLGVLGVTGFLMKNLSANPLDYVEGGAFNERRAGALGHPRRDQPGSLGVSEARRQDDRHHRHQRHAGLAGRTARLLPVGARSDGPRDRRSLRTLFRDATDWPWTDRQQLQRGRRRDGPFQRRRFRTATISLGCCSTGSRRGRRPGCP